MPETTQQAARRLNVPYWKLFHAIRSGRLRPPQKNGAGDYMWFEEDIEAARSALTAPDRRRKAVSA